MSSWPRVAEVVRLQLQGVAEIVRFLFLSGRHGLPAQGQSKLKSYDFSYVESLSQPATTAIHRNRHTRETAAAVVPL